MLSSVLALSVLAQAEPVTLDRALELLHGHPSALAARRRVEAAQAEVAAAKALYAPSLGAVAEVVVGTAANSTATVLPSSAVDLARVGATPVSSAVELAPRGSTLVAIGARQLLWDFGRWTATTDIASAELEAAVQSDAAVWLDLELGVRRAYLGVLAAHAVLQAATEATTRARAHRDFARAAVAQQLRAPIELARADATLARATVDEARAESDVTRARVQLAAAVGGERTELDAVPREEAPAPPLPEFGIVAAAVDADPSLRAVEASLRSRRAQVRLLEAQQNPSLGLSLSVSGRNGGATPSSGVPSPSAGWVPDVPNYAAGVVLNWPLFDLAALRRSDAAQVRVDAALAEFAALRRARLAAAAEAVERARVAEGSLSALRDAARAAKDNAAQAEARFSAGLSTSVELADAEDLRTGADIALVVGRFRALDARAVLSRFLEKESP